MPVLLAWMVHKLRYGGRAVAAQTLLCWVILWLTYALTDPAQNINCVFGLPGRQPQRRVPDWLYLAAVMAYFPIAFYLPVHLLLRKLRW